MWKVIAYYTPQYEKVHDQILAPSLSKFRIPAFTVPVKSRGSWQKNTGFKPEFCLSMLTRPDVDVIYVDCDAEFTRYPELFDKIPLDCDIALHRLEWGEHYGHSHGKQEILSGTLYLRNNAPVKAMLKVWANKCLTSNCWEQTVLEQVLNELRGVIKVYDLPREYCYIKTLPSGGDPVIPIKDPCIIHHQKSRELKQTIVNG